MIVRKRCCSPCEYRRQDFIPRPIKFRPTSRVEIVGRTADIYHSVVNTTASHTPCLFGCRVMWRCGFDYVLKVFLGNRTYPLRGYIEDRRVRIWYIGTRIVLTSTKLVLCTTSTLEHEYIISSRSESSGHYGTGEPASTIIKLCVELEEEVVVIATVMVIRHRTIHISLISLSQKYVLRS